MKPLQTMRRDGLLLRGTAARWVLLPLIGLLALGPTELHKFPLIADTGIAG